MLTRPEHTPERVVPLDSPCPHGRRRSHIFRSATHSSLAAVRAQVPNHIQLLQVSGRVFSVCPKRSASEFEIMTSFEDQLGESDGAMPFGRLVTASVIIIGVGADEGLIGRRYSAVKTSSIVCLFILYCRGPMRRDSLFGYINERGESCQPADMITSQSCVT